MKPLAVGVVLVACLVFGGCGEIPDQEPFPNVLLVVLDTTRRDRIGVYGNDKGLTPALDALAAEGTIYDNAISAGSWTLPSHASICTGLYPRDHGTTVEHWKLLPEFTTLAEILRDQGYSTIGVCSNPWVSQSTGLHQGFTLRNRGERAVQRHAMAEHDQAFLRP